MPLPDAAQLTNIRIRLALIDVTTIVNKLKNAKVPCPICRDGTSHRIEKVRLSALWNATAAKPPHNP